MLTCFSSKEVPRNKSKLLFTDTDSQTYEIEAEDVYKDFHEDKQMFDNSDYLEDSPFYFKDNKKVIGKMKDKAAGCPITEFIGLRSTMYSYIKDDNKCGGRTAKGIKKSVIKKSVIKKVIRQLRDEQSVSVMV